MSESENTSDDQEDMSSSDDSFVSVESLCAATAAETIQISRLPGNASNGISLIYRPKDDWVDPGTSATSWYNRVHEFAGVDDRLYGSNGKVLYGVRLRLQGLEHVDINGVFDIWNNNLYIVSKQLLHVYDLLGFRDRDLSILSTPLAPPLLSTTQLDLGNFPVVYAIELDAGFLYVGLRSEMSPKCVNVFDVNRNLKLSEWPVDGRLNLTFLSVNRMNGHVVIPNHYTAEILEYSRRGETVRCLNVGDLLLSTKRPNMQTFAPFRAFAIGHMKYRVLHAIKPNNKYEPIVVTELRRNDDDDGYQIVESRNVVETSDDNHLERLNGSDGRRSIVTFDWSEPIAHRGVVHNTNMINLLDDIFNVVYHYQLIHPRSLPEDEFPLRLDHKMGHLLINILGELVYYNTKA